MMHTEEKAELGALGTAYIQRKQKEYIELVQYYMNERRYNELGINGMLRYANGLATFGGLTHPLHVAIIKEDVQTIQALYTQNAACVDAVDTREFLTGSSETVTAFYLACDVGNVEIVQLFLEYGADPVCTASECKIYYDTADYGLMDYADENYYQSTMHPHSPLQVAIKNEHAAVVQLLLANVHNRAGCVEACVFAIKHRKASMVALFDENIRVEALHILKQERTTTYKSKKKYAKRHGFIGELSQDFEREVEIDRRIAMGNPPSPEIAAVAEREEVAAEANEIQERKEEGQYVAFSGAALLDLLRAPRPVIGDWEFYPNRTHRSDSDYAGTGEPPLPPPLPMSVVPDAAGQAVQVGTSASSPSSTVATPPIQISVETSALLPPPLPRVLAPSMMDAAWQEVQGGAVPTPAIQVPSAAETGLFNTVWEEARATFFAPSSAPTAPAIAANTEMTPEEEWAYHYGPPPVEETPPAGMTDFISPLDVHSDPHFFSSQGPTPPVPSVSDEVDGIQEMLRIVREQAHAARDARNDSGSSSASGQIAVTATENLTTQGALELRLPISGVGRCRL